MTSEWERDDYILEGTPCPRSNIRRLLEIARLDSATPCFVLAAIDEADFQEPLCLVAHEDKARGKRIEKRFRGRSLTRPDALGRPSLEAITSELHDFLDLNGEGFAIEAVRAHPHGLEQESSIAVVVLAIGAPRQEVDQKWVRELHLRINATIYADIRRDHLAAQQVQAGSRLPEATTVAESYQQSVDGLLELMREVSDSDGAAYYRLDGPGSGLTLGVAVPEAVECPLPHSIPHPADEANSSPLARLLARSLDSTSIILDGGEVEETKAYLEVVATAVPAIAIGRDNINQGVIAVWNFDQTSKRFDRSQLGWMRNVALRLALLETSFEAEESAGEIASLSGRLASPDEPVLDPDGPLVMDGTPVPHDLRHVSGTWNELVERVRDATRSASVTIRILRHRRADGRLQVSLLRFASSPNPLGTEEAEEIYVTGTHPKTGIDYWRTSLNAYVAFKGEQVYVYDVANLPPPTYQPATGRPRLQSYSSQGADGLHSILPVPGRPDVRSTICLPIIVDGTLVGTMNLESPFVDAYSHLKSSITAFAQLAGVSLAMVRQRIGHELSLSSAIAGLSVAHEAAHFETELRDLEANLEASGSDIDLTPLFDRLRNVRTAPVEEERDDSTLSVIIDEVLAERRRKAKVVPDIDAHISAQITVLGRDVDATTMVVDELLDNLFEHANITDTTTPTIRNSLIFFGGVQYEVIQIENVAGVPPSPDLISRLYASGTTLGDDEVHLGCYVIGQLVRRMGGNVFATAERNSPTSPTLFRTTLLLPRHRHP